MGGLVGAGSGAPGGGGGLPANLGLNDPTSRRGKKINSFATPERIALERAFSLNPKPTSEDITIMANDLCVEKEIVRVWFQNR